jgi:hypothetical protein
MEEQYIRKETNELGESKGYPFSYDFLPTQSLLQKWLREVHQIYVDVDIDQTTYPKFCYMISRFIGNPTNLAAEEWDWKNYPNGENWSLHRKWEDALEEGLFEALKLI